MQYLIQITCFLLASASFTYAADSQSTLRYLGIGNSFTWNSTEYLDELVESQGKDFELFVAGIGGASLERHLRSVRIHESDPSDPEGRPYKMKDADGKETAYSLKELLQQHHWDYISIQQLSALSFKEESYEPFASELITYIREHSPESEIIVHMTWAYREDHQWFVNGELTQDEMYKKLQDAYLVLSKRYDLRIIPIGTAFHEARKMPEWTYYFPDPNFDYNDASPPNIPAQPNSLNAGWYWREDKETGEESLRLDATHAGDYGKFLAGLVHYEFFFGETIPTDELPTNLGLEKEKLGSLSQAAHQAIATYEPYNSERGN
ncbi:DUF4886 domain-containing protein [Pelagicoccus sp. SDUM812002]|uniref:DUF4886 domain-containing protein n=1 Tax=Pelagicoccus sp. SDUM812002 TaxID=3041266 RepID=UPI00280DFE77|nr:DUF4886 domain-containing protein [Pelagicoccus sp. SDUM812002]MDQ8184646.1 DUF4886 domain-containing protein [Pelagicoccus sp. SDUM812002]